jgi:hypothetical protein
LLGANVNSELVTRTQVVYALSSDATTTQSVRMVAVGTRMDADTTLGHRWDAGANRNYAGMTMHAGRT